jgi:cytochrome c peroxidase
MEAGSSLAQNISGAPPSLSTLQVPEPGNLDDFVKNKPAAIILGKALFWDEQTGGDGRVACATCHFSSGVDARTTNTVSPGPNGIFNSVPGPGATLTLADFPLAGDDIVGSQGVVRADFNGLDLANPLAIDDCTSVDDGTFFPEPRVTGRNAPSVIMAAFNRDNFWDGRAKRDFNGVTPAGPGDPSDPTVLVDDGSGLEEEEVVASPASPASQAVGPPNNAVEMSCAGRSFPELGRKLLNKTPLGLQMVAPDDSVLGALSAAPANGLTTTYAAMIQAAFHDEFHASAELTPDGFTQMEANFSLFWGLSVNLYVNTLIPDDSPFDQFREGNLGALTPNQIAGLDVFLNKGKCISCHGGPEFTRASIVNFSGGSAFANTGVTPTAADGGRQPENKGKFKTPTVRNAELTGPYFHNGRYVTLRQVVDFYNRGGDVMNADKDSRIRPLGLTAAEKNALVDFMLALTDNRVRFRMAPFDGPSLDPVNGTPIAAVGAGGAAAPITPFLNVNHFSP